MEDPSRGDPHQHAGPGCRRAHGRGRRVVAGVEDEQGNLAVDRGTELTSRFTWSTVAVPASSPGDAAGVEWERSSCRGPSPAGRSTDRTTRPRWAGRPSAWTPSSRSPARGCTRRRSGPRSRRRRRRPGASPLGGERPTAPRNRCPVECSLGQGLVEAAVRSAELRLQAQRGHRADRCRRAQRRVAQLEQGVAPGGEAAVELRAKPDQLPATGSAYLIQTVCLLSASR